MDEYKFITFLEHFEMHYKLLKRRYRRFTEINDIRNLDIDVITYLDIIIVQLRAMCIESSGRKKNYTAQNLLKLVKRDDLAKKIDDMLAEEFFSYRKNFDIRKALKVMADNYICHYDAFDDDISAEIIEKQLRNPYDKHNLKYIMETVFDCIEEGLSLKTFLNAIEIDDNRSGKQTDDDADISHEKECNQSLPDL